MNALEEKEQLKSRDYDGIPLEVCQAVHDTIKKEKYRKCVILPEDVNLVDWVKLSNPELIIHVIPAMRVDFAIVSIETDQAKALDLTRRIKKGGQIAFYDFPAEPLRKYFNEYTNYEQWMTVELGLGEGIFIARRI